ncbi:MAG TPA: GNAT family N-acetyltransferase [Gemmatimonadaceae bacterium]|nr:GNAT family N-acetyltransferase [Gemmatimonadaceae bacterium]
MTGRLTVAPLLPEHRTLVEHIVRATGVFSDAEIAVAIELFDDTFSSASAGESDYEFVGAFADDRLVGYACFGATPSTDRTYDLYWIAVHPQAQRSGAGAALMADLERRLAERQARLVTIETSSRTDYAATRQFYHQRGYVEAARLRDFYALGDDRVILTKRLASAHG